MRYLIAIVSGFICAGLTAKFIGPWLAPMVTRMFSYDSPDGEALVEQATFVGALGVALLIGWMIGWAIGRSLEKPEKPI